MGNTLYKFLDILKGNFALAVFMDIQGAFDSTTFAAIQETLESRDVGRTAIR